MAHTSVNDQAFEACTRGLIQPNHIYPLAAEYHHSPQIFQPRQGAQGNGEDEAEYLQVLNCVMNEDGDRALATFRGCEYYRLTPNSEELEDVPEDDSDSDGEEFARDEEENLTEATADVDPTNLEE